MKKIIAGLLSLWLGLCGVSYGAVAFQTVGTRAAGGGSITSLSGNLPSGITTGDALIAILATWKSGGDTSGASASGWTSFADVNDGGGRHLYAFWRVATGSDAMSVSWTTGSWADLRIARYNGTDATTPLKSSRTSTSTSGGFGSLTAAVGDLLLLAISGSNSSNGITGSPTVTSEWYDPFSSFDENAGWDLQIVSAGATTNYVTTAAGNDVGVALLLQPTVPPKSGQVIIGQ